MKICRSCRIASRPISPRSTCSPIRRAIRTGTASGGSVEVATSDPTYTIRTRDGYFAAAPIPIRPTLEFTARDANRRLLTIDAPMCIVVEDGVEQTVTSFQEASEPVSIVMALDKSGSMRQEEEAVKAAAGSFIDSLRAEDKLGVVGFSDGAEVLADIAPYRTWSRHAVNQYRTNGGTSLYDGIRLSLERLEGVEGRKAIVVMTDGRDENNPGTAPGSKATVRRNHPIPQGDQRHGLCHWPGGQGRSA